MTSGEVDSSAARCEPTAGGPYNVLEKEQLTVQLRCETGLEQPNRFSIEGLPPGAVLDKDSATLTWTPALDQAAVYELTVRAKPSNETAPLKIAVADRFDDPNNVLIRDPATYTEELGLPVLHLTPDPAIHDDAYLPATIIYRGHTFTGAQARYRGTVSAAYPKRSFTLKFTKADKFGDADRAGGFADKRKIVLITSFDDNSYLRQRLSFELWNRLGPTQIKLQSYSVVVYLKGRYYGLYTLADHVNGYLMEDHGLLQEGNLFKARSTEANFHPLKANGEAKLSVHDGFTKEEGTPLPEEPGAFDDLDAFLEWVNTAPSDTFAAELDTRIQRSDYENWWIFSTFAMADDSVGKNSYHYRDPSTPGSRWRTLPWDFNHSFGQDWRTYRTDVRATEPEKYYLWANGMWTRILSDPSLGPALRKRYGEVLGSEYSVDAVLEVIERMRDEIAPSARRDESKWSAVYRGYGSWNKRTDFTTFDEEIEHMRDWIRGRHAYLDGLY